MTGAAISRRVFMRGAACALPALGAVFGAPRALGSRDCGDPTEVIDGCAAELPEEFSWTSFSTTAAVGGGTYYSLLFTTRITPGPPVPAAATGYRIDSLSLAGTTREGTAFSVVPSAGERGSRAIWIRWDSSLGFTVDVPWDARQLVRSFEYTYNVVYLNGINEIQTCTYVTTVKLADNRSVDGAVGSLSFSPPRLTACSV